MTIARPTAASAAATVITKKVMIWPSTVPRERPTATNVRFTALSMISIESSTVIRLRRRNTPAVPIEKRMPDSTRKWLNGTMDSVLLPRQDDGADHRHEDENRGHLERKCVLGEECLADVGHRAHRLGILGPKIVLEE